MANTVKFERVIEKCMDCPDVKVVPDPDPYDWFCADDVALVCTKCKDKMIAGALRPYEKKNVMIPDWCPFIKTEE